MLSWKCWYYGKACEQGNEDFAANLPEGLPEDGRRLWDAAHSKTDENA